MWWYCNSVAPSVLICCYSVTSEAFFTRKINCNLNSCLFHRSSVPPTCNRTYSGQSVRSPTEQQLPSVFARCTTHRSHRVAVTTIADISMWIREERRAAQPTSCYIFSSTVKATRLFSLWATEPSILDIWREESHCASHTPSMRASEPTAARSW